MFCLSMFHPICSCLLCPYFVFGSVYVPAIFYVSALFYVLLKCHLYNPSTIPTDILSSQTYSDSAGNFDKSSFNWEGLLRLRFSLNGCRLGLHLPSPRHLAQLHITLLLIIFSSFISSDFPLMSLVFVN